MLRHTGLTGLWACLVAQNLISPALAGEPYPYSDEWWALRAGDPPGARQVEKDGKLWPPYPRPTGEKQHWVHKYHHAHYWPHPYNCDDQAFVRNLIDQQAAGGWIGATTLQDYHFDPETQQLNSVGRDHLQWIVVATPVQYRSIYIAQSPSSSVDLQRTAVVEQSVREFRPEGGIPVSVRYDRYRGRPAQEIDQLRRMELQSLPAPRLFTVRSRSGGSSGGSGGSQGGGGSGSGQSSTGTSPIR
ncbi:hypothetical protein GC163_05090 [bacterium]|nr:hypothetical protein [bacterium]